LAKITQNRLKSAKIVKTLNIQSKSVKNHPKLAKKIPNWPKTGEKTIIRQKSPKIG
jgi:hypothetical protein